MAEITAQHAEALAAFPPELRTLIDAELAAGNTLVELAGGFPAPPAGLYVKLSRMVTTRPHASGDGVTYFDRGYPGYSGEWADARRFFFVLEPPRPQPPDPDMNAIRAQANAGVGMPPPPPAPRPRTAAGPTALVERFQASMAIDYEKWHDGIGYDVALIRQASPDERAQIEELVLPRGAADWRDVEALAALDSPRSRSLLESALRHSKPEILAAIRRHAPELVSAQQRVKDVCDALRTATFGYGLSEVIDEVARFHPPEVVAELFRGLLTREGAVAVHYAAMLTYIHGQAAEPFDWEQRPFFLGFGTDDRNERRRRLRELCDRIGIDPAPYVAAQ